MKTPCLTMTLAVSLLSVPLASWAQQVAPAATKTQPHVQTPAERRDSAATPGNLRPEDPVVPQIKLPLGKTAAPSLSAASAAQMRRRQARGGIEDTAARCAAEAGSSARAACRDRLARAKRAP